MYSRFSSKIFQNIRQRPLPKLPISASANFKSAGAGSLVGGGILLSGLAGTTLYAKEEKQQTAPKYVKGGSPFDLTKFEGRFWYFVECVDPRTLYLSDTEIADAKKLLADYDTKGSLPDGATDSDMWNAKRIIDAAVHPATGEKMFFGGRMAMFVPMNIPIGYGMMVSKSTAGILFWQWFNQSFNVVNNYVNRSSAEVEYSKLAQCYGLAVVTSCSIAMGFKALIVAVPALGLLGPVIPYLAVISAGSANVAFTRMGEITDGVPVFDDNGKELGISMKAGREAVLQTVVTRSCCLPIGILLIPPAVMGALNLSPGALTTAVELSVVSVCVAIGLPLCLALAPQKMTIDVNKLEPEFQQIKDNGGYLKHVFANKGL